MYQVSDAKISRLTARGKEAYINFSNGLLLLGFWVSREELGVLGTQAWIAVLGPLYMHRGFFFGVW